MRRTAQDDQHPNTPTAALRSAVLNARPTNPALQRLQGRARLNAEASEIITSYDRMHHRHNRS